MFNLWIKKDTKLNVQQKTAFTVFTLIVRRCHISMDMVNIHTQGNYTQN